MIDNSPQEPDIRPQGRRLVLGRGHAADVAIDDASVAPRHAMLYCNQVGLHVTGIEGSIVVNGRSIASTSHLRDGDWLQLGNVRFKVLRDGLVSPVTHSNGISITALTLEQSQQVILGGVSLAIRRGEFVGILGPSGSGKSSLIRCMLGYSHPTAGDIRVGGNEIPGHARLLWKTAGYVPQDDVLFRLLTVFENLNFSLQLREPMLNSKERIQIIRKRLEEMRLTDKSDQLVLTLSGGERKRVSVAQELLTSPMFLFLDEPTAGLDPANEARLMGELKRIAGAGVTIVCATHVLESAELLDRAVIMVGGLVAYDGNPSEMLGALRAKNYRELYDESRLQRYAKKHQPSDHVERPKMRLPKQQQEAVSCSQLAALLSRGARMMLRDVPWLVMLILQPIVIGILINLSQHTGKIELLFTFAAVSSVWLGLSNTSRELVKERAHYMRERHFGISSYTYIASKVILYALVGAVQLAIVVVVLLMVTDTSIRTNLLNAGSFAIWLCLWSAYLGAVMTGLWVSAVAKTQEWAIAFVPLLILPQLLLTKEATTMTGERHFKSIYNLFENGGKDRNGEVIKKSVPEITVELLSLSLQTRPCIALLSTTISSQEKLPHSFSRSLPMVADIVHSIVLIIAPGFLLLWTVRIQEPYWLKSYGTHP